MLMIVMDTSQNSLISLMEYLKAPFLGASLFVIYVNNLLYLMEENNVASIEMYADDTVLHVSDSCAIKTMGQSNAAMDMLNSALRI